MSVLTPDPVLRLLERAAAQCGPGAARLHAVLAADFPAALSRRPAQLLRAADANAEDLDQLLAMAGFADTEDLRACAARETGRRLPVPDQRIADREGEPGDRTALRRILAREQENLAGTLDALHANGALELAARAVVAGRRRWVFGDMKSIGYAALVAADLSAALRDVTLVQPGVGAAVTALADAGDQDVLITFSFRSYSRHTVRLAREFHALGGTVVAITDGYDSPVCAYATHVLAVNTRSESRTHSPTAVTATGHLLASLAAAGAKGAARRAQRRYDLTWALSDGESATPAGPPERTAP
ncbi:MurR/RpiR family transcriptional regulator [Streptomyces sp. NPDC002917]|uniref:MurR/RpiR family transcriptional regulator n=1 Tax=unclassified Streptomyces TaxID=2593676 RepID=UPI002E8235E8|nr:SIS domain-containing protein [Streptomyces sp. NBC_00562]WTC83505.1 SIS domain-containing protein [Streptomyces sp. NBC_01653]WTD31842.1 SIS domain-containing protein [Streptomyces sp. NBC_01643]WTD87359.1 SIS domain-containing protein [Streptomyces sp. NBC_01637]WUC18448.1 SIS domain-containing protein [Streptomyces sp. NBC_00562]